MIARLKHGVMSGVMLLIGIAALLMSLPWAWETALLPRVASIGVILFGVAQVISDLRRPSEDEGTGRRDSDTLVGNDEGHLGDVGLTSAMPDGPEPAASTDQVTVLEDAQDPAAASGIRAWIVGFLWPIVFLVLTLTVGLPIGGGIATTAWFWRGGPKGWARAVLLGVVVFVVLQFGFNYLLGVPLPTGYIRISFY